jgi:hypothetical protein
MSWIEAKSTVEIALFVFSIAYLAAAIIFCLVASLSRRSVAKDLKTRTGLPDDTAGSHPGSPDRFSRVAGMDESRSCY